MAQTVESDVVVVGSGIAGSMAAYQLATKGMKVAVIEKGQLLSPETVEDVYRSESFIGHPRVACENVDILRDRKTIRKKLPSVVGGLARFYAGVSLRMREAEFLKWPYGYDSLEPYYSLAETLIGVSGNAGQDPLDPRRSKPYPQPLPEMSRLSRRLYEGASRLGLKPFQHPIAIKFENRCVRCNYCNQVPCAYGAKWSPDELWRGRNDLPIQIFEATTATRILPSELGPGVSVGSIEATSSLTGETVLFRAKKFVLAGGALFTPSLLLKSGYGRTLPWLGAGLMTHCLALVVGVFPSRISEEYDFHKWWSVSDHYYDDKGNVRGLIQQDHLTTQKSLHAKIPKIFHRLVDAFYYRTCQLLVIAEDDPNAENRVEWSDTDGRLVVHQKFGAEDMKRRDFLVKQAKRVLKKAGAVLTLSFSGQSVYHACGTCRMGTDSSNSVTDAQGKVWGVDNLFVADASLMPTSSGVNPSLTIAAMALKVADHVQ